MLPNIFPFFFSDRAMTSNQSPILILKVPVKSTGKYCIEYLLQSVGRDMLMAVWGFGPWQEIVVCVK